MPTPGKIVFINSNEPIPVITRKINTLHQTGRYRPYLIYWHRVHSDLNFSFSLQTPQETVYRINLPDSRGNPFKRLLYHSLFWIKTATYILTIKPQIVHSVNMDIWLQAFLLKFINFRLKFILDLIDTRDVFVRKQIIPLVRFFLWKTSLIFITSPRYATDYLNRFGLSPTDPRIVFIPNAPPRGQFDGFSKKPSKELRIGYIGAFRGKETIEHLVGTVEQLRSQGYPIRIIFAGMGKDLKLIKTYARQANFIEYAGPYNYERDISGLYEKTDVLFSVYYPDRDKSIHLSCRYHDAIVCRIPIIVQAGSYQSELVAQNQIGYVIELGKWNQLETLLRKLCEDPGDLRKKSNNSRNLLHENIFETYAPRIVASYATLDG